MFKKQDQEFLRKLGATIRRVRKRKGFTQETLAFAAHVNRGFMGEVERGERNISTLNIKKIARTLGVSVATLFQFDKP